MSIFPSLVTEVYGWKWTELGEQIEMLPNKMLHSDSKERVNSHVICLFG